MSVWNKPSILISLTFLAMLGIPYFLIRRFLLQDVFAAEESTTRDGTRLLEDLA